MDTTGKLTAASEGEKEPGMPYRDVIGALVYLATTTRPDLAVPVGYLSRYGQRPNVAHAAALKRVLRYLAATQNQGVFFKNQGHGAVNKVVIDGYVDAEPGNCPETRKSESGYALKMAGGPVAWAARRQSIVALSTAAAQYAAAYEACQEGQSIKNVLMEIIGERDLEFNLGADNQTAISLAPTPRTAGKLDTSSYGNTLYERLEVRLIKLKSP
ncbi:hypothetical protein PC129_g20533 [Phytophthora cactorum]|uniref:Reverse transcriptase Ty1/copia-type domain-containing protein n=1 Tax=Phytophthora cactorum TaxID=29920 RepID=A0A329RK35_9STRA|nr:hypothetical protein Pcac1_g7132 [Phytophthora cactorum]KAG2798397.1 hypothetical protein PC111_g20869 [Phytophthora cactorum]KAG2881197.1 hypothetical protein PC114_g21679 [Phytophthora cactorum]KAG2891014.1 hypothetical protein PC115_g19341 [Phytophthora cactorum]KAG2902226.1 hypothetical protein PC117_g21527 [Phytophthora cactorum]